MSTDQHGDGAGQGDVEVAFDEWWPTAPIEPGQRPRELNCFKAGVEWAAPPEVRAVVDAARAWTRCFKLHTIDDLELKIAIREAVYELERVQGAGKREEEEVQLLAEATSDWIDPEEAAHASTD